MSLKKKIQKLLSCLYDYQQDALMSTEKSKKGIICMPTGTGKTRIQAALLALSIIRSKGKHKIYVINAPRIMLSYQLLKEVYTFLTMAGIDARYMSVHSGGSADMQDLEKIRQDANDSEGYSLKFAEFASGTSTTLIREFAETAQRQDLPLIFFSTYNSAGRIDEAIPEKEIEAVVNDEAHYLVQEQFYDIIHILKSKRCYFFTATTRETPSETGRGMNNKDSYGEIIYLMTPREAIDRGKMARPRVMFVSSSGDIRYNSDDFQTSLGKIIFESFRQHSYAIGFSKAKMLVTVKGTSDIKRFFESVEYAQLVKNGTLIYAVASDEKVGNNINGVKVSRREFLNRLKIDGADRTKEIIILHYDILAEGIDVPGITGILPLRTLMKAKFLQTYGRAARLDIEDRRKLEDGEMGVHDLNLFNKPYAWVIVPTIIHEDADSKEHIGNLITELRDYGFNPSEDILTTSTPSGLPTVDGPDALNEIKKKCPNIGRYIEKVEASYEEERIAKLSHIDLLKEKLAAK